MTELTITPKVSDKTARFKGTIAAGEHVAVTIKGGAEWIGEDEGANLTLRVIDLVTKRTLAVFPRPPEVMDEGAEPDAWADSGEDLTCTLNLNTTRMVDAARHMLRVPVMFVLGDTDAPRTLYFRDKYEVEYWPERIGDDVPYDLDAWPKQIDEWMELVDEWTEQMATFGETLSGHVGNVGIHVTAEQKAAWTAKQNAIADLDAIREGAARGAKAIQEHQDISRKADLVGGKVPQSQLPSYVDDVLEFAAAANFPATGEEGKIYVAKDENKTYRWSGTQYVQIGGSDMTVDPALDDTSTNPVQNKVVKAAVDAKCTVGDAVAEVTRTVPAQYSVTWNDCEYDVNQYKFYDENAITGASELNDDGVTPQDVGSDRCYCLGDGGYDSSGYHIWLCYYDGETWTNVDGFDLEGEDVQHAADGTLILPFQDGPTVTQTKTEVSPERNAHGLARLVDLPTKTSDLTNDGPDGVHPFLTEHQSLAGLMPMYALGATPTIAEETVSWAFSSNTLPRGMVPRIDAPYYEEGSWLLPIFNPQDEADVDFAMASGDGSETTVTLSYGGGSIVATKTTTPATLTVSPYTSATYTADTTAEAFEIAVGALPTGVTGKARDCILVIDCTATGAVAPTVTWGTHFHPRTDIETDLAIVKAGKRAVFYISEYTAGEFAVGGWQETAGGSGT